MRYNMSNDKPCAIATIKFYPNKHVEVELDSIATITPRTLDIASNILGKTYRGMKHAHNAQEHRKAREVKKEAEDQIAKDEAEYHEKYDAEQAELAAAAASMPKATPAPKEEVPLTSGTTQEPKKLEVKEPEVKKATGDAVV